MKLQRVLFISCMALAASLSVWASGRAPVPLTLIAVPAEYTPLQIGQDLAARYPAVLVSYQQDPNVGGLFLHAWDGHSWRAVSQDEFGRAGFVKMTPKRTVIVGSGPAASSLVDLADSWCPEVLNLASSKSADIVNTVGRLFEFNSSEWRWFASRYQMDIQDLNENRRKESWYDQPYTDPERSNRGTVVTPPVRPAAHSMSWPPSAPVSSEEVETVGTVSAVEAINEGSAVAVESAPENVPEVKAVSAPMQPQGESLQIRPPSFRGWQAPASDLSDIK